MLVPLNTTAVYRRLPLMTLLLVAANVSVYLLQTAATGEELRQILNTFGVIPARQTVALHYAPAAMEMWALPNLTAAFLHADLPHLLANVVFLLPFGRILEAELGPGRFLALYLGAALLAWQLEVFVDPMSTGIFIGASGAVAALVGAALVLVPRVRVWFLAFVFAIPVVWRVSMVAFVALWVGFQVFFAIHESASGASGTAWWTHLGGFVIGVAAASLFLHRGRRSAAA